MAAQYLRSAATCRIRTEEPYARTYPTAPVWPGLPPIPAPVDVVWFASLWILLGLMLVEGSRRLCAGLFLALTVPLMLWDQGRWQPPIYQYVLLLAALTVYPVRTDPTARGRALQTARVIIAATYFWSGVQKINATFVGPLDDSLVTGAGSRRR